MGKIKNLYYYDNENVQAKINIFRVLQHQVWLYDIELVQGMILCDIPYPEDKYLNTDTRCDFHPRWNPSVSKICFDAFLQHH